MRVLHRLRVVGFDLSPLVQQQVNDLNRGGIPHVVGVRLEREAQHADRLAPEAAQDVAQFGHEPLTLVVVDLHHRPQHLGVRPMRGGHVRQGFDVLGEAGTAPADAGPQELRADAMVTAHAPRHLLHVGPQPLADVGYFVDERNLGRQEGVGSVLDHLGRAQVGDDRLGVQWIVQFGHPFGRLPAGGTEHDAVRVHAVIDAGPFAQELGVGDDPEGDAGIGHCSTHDVGDPIAGADRHSGLIDDDGGLVDAAGDFGRGRLDVSQVRLAALTRGCAHGDEDDLRILHRLVVGGSEAQPPGLVVAPHDLLQARLVDGQDALLQVVGLLLVTIQADDVVAQVGQASAGDQAHVADTDDTDVLHSDLFLLEVIYVRDP